MVSVPAVFVSRLSFAHASCDGSPVSAGGKLACELGAVDAAPLGALVEPPGPQAATSSETTPSVTIRRRAMDFLLFEPRSVRQARRIPSRAPRASPSRSAALPVDWAIATAPAESSYASRSPARVSPNVRDQR